MDPLLDDTPPSTGLTRYGWASARLDLEPGLLHHWADHEDRSIRRAVMRSPELDPESAELLVATRRSGMHTMGLNPVAPLELLGSNPGARRRRRRLLQAVPGGLDDVQHDPGGPGQVAAGSPTLDLALARHPDLPAAAAFDLLERATPPVDPWVGALLAVRCRMPADELPSRWSADRRRSSRALFAAAEAFVARRGLSPVGRSGSGTGPASHR